VVWKIWSDHAIFLPLEMGRIMAKALIIGEERVWMVEGYTRGWPFREL
jgi:hypothetical protein